MSLPPRSFGDRRGHSVVVGPCDGGGWTAVVDGGRASASGSERAARVAAAEEVLRLEATAHALLRRIRRGLRRKLT